MPYLLPERETYTLEPFWLKLLYCQLLLAALPPQLDGSSFISVAWLWCEVFSRYDSLMQMAQLEVDAIMGVTIISVGLWRKAEQRGHGRGGHFAVVLWMTVLPAPLASSSHCPASAWSPGTCRSCSPSSSTSWSFIAQCCLRCSSLVDSLCRSAYASFVALTASPAAVARGTLVRALLAGVLSQAEVEVHANSGLC